MSERKHVYRGKYGKELKSARSRKGFGYTHYVDCDSEIYFDGMGLRSNELSQEKFSDSKVR